jgi:hypothetical protein
MAYKAGAKYRLFNVSYILSGVQNFTLYSPFIEILPLITTKGYFEQFLALFCHPIQLRYNGQKRFLEGVQSYAKVRKAF